MKQNSIKYKKQKKQEEDRDTDYTNLYQKLKSRGLLVFLKHEVNWGPQDMP